MRQRMLAQQSTAERKAIQPPMPDLDEQYLRVNEVATKLSMSPSWVRRHFSNVSGVLKLGTPKRFKRTHFILLIPISVLRRELARLSI